MVNWAAGTEAEPDGVRSLMRMLVGWQYERHAEYHDLIARYFDAAGFEAEIAALSGGGKAPAERIVAEAMTAGYTRMMLDTGPRQREAQGLCRWLGFVPTAPLYDLEAEMRNWLVFMELTLAD